jgi:hypothetical protein
MHSNGNFTDKCPMANGLKNAGYNQNNPQCSYNSEHAGYFHGNPPEIIRLKRDYHYRVPLNSAIVFRDLYKRAIQDA